MAILTYHEMSTCHRRLHIRFSTITTSDHALSVPPFHAHLFDIKYLSLPLANYLVNLYIRLGNS
jgi:hypothetical protein